MHIYVICAFKKADKALKSNNKKISDFNINNLLNPPKN